MRDPRDALVSQYFSILSTHSSPAVNHGKGGATEQLLEIAEMPLERPFIDGVMQRVDIMPASEDPSRFIRKVVPGDHLVKLRRATIESLNLVFADVADVFGYRLR